MFALILPMFLVDVFVLDRSRSSGRRHRGSHDAAAARLRGGQAQRKVGNLAIAELLEKAQTSPPLEHRLLQVLHLSYRPLLLAIWLA